jgi:hypothetical protein
VEMFAMIFFYLCISSLVTIVNHHQNILL